MPLHFTNLNDITATYEHIYISPHLDDAALSCGGAIARHIANNQHVLVATVCTAAPSIDTTFSPFAQELHSAWELEPSQAMATRRHEDIEALECLGVDGYWMDFLDAIYRRPDVYTSNTTLFGAVAPDDPLIAEFTATLGQLMQRWPNAIIYAPLGIGEHVDHQIIYTVSTSLIGNGGTIAFYEDFPYVSGNSTLERRMERLGVSAAFVPSVLNIDATLARKISSIEAYTSQIKILFGDTASMIKSVTAYAETIRPDLGTYGERLWLRQA